MTLEEVKVAASVWSLEFRDRERERESAMDSSSHMASLPEDIITDEHLQQQTQPASASAFASVPQRPPTK